MFLSKIFYPSLVSYEARLKRETGVLSSDVVENESEHVVLDEEGISRGLEDKVLHEGLRGVIISLELTQHVDKNAAVKHGLTVRCCDEVLYLLEGEASKLLHDLGRPLHLLALEGKKGLIRIVKLLEVGSSSYIVKYVVVLFNKGFAYLLILRVQIGSHPYK